MYVLLQLYREVVRLHGRVSRASQTRPARISDMFGRYLGAELYCSCRTLLALISARQVDSLLNTSQPSQHKLIACTADWTQTRQSKHSILFIDILVDFDDGSIYECFSNILVK